MAVVTEPTGLQAWRAEHTRTLRPAYAATPMCTGTPRQRRTVTAAPSAVKLVRRLSLAQAAVWRAWWADDAQLGVQPFQAQVGALGAGLEVVAVSALSQPSYKPDDTGAWVEVSLEALVRPASDLAAPTTFTFTQGATNSANDAGFGGNITPVAVQWPAPPSGAIAVRITVTSTHPSGLYLQGSSWVAVGLPVLAVFGSPGVTTTSVMLGLPYGDLGPIHGTLQFVDSAGDSFGPVYTEAV